MKYLRMYAEAHTKMIMPDGSRVVTCLNCEGLAFIPIFSEDGNHTKANCSTCNGAGVLRLYDHQLSMRY
jgi:hypothetical protein